MHTGVPGKGYSNREGKMTNMEVEMKVKLENLEDMKDKLLEMGAKFGQPKQQVDSYFESPGFTKDIVRIPGDSIIRIRKSDGRATLTSKTLTEITGAWIEHETHIEKPDEMEKILLASKFTPVFTFNKMRTKGRMDEFEICLDDIKELGKYMEVSIETDAHDEKENIRRKIIDFIKTLGIDESMVEKRGYGEIMGEMLGMKFGGYEIALLSSKALAKK